MFTYFCKIKCINPDMMHPVKSINEEEYDEDGHQDLI